MDDQARYERAKKRAGELRGCYQHIATYVLINLFLLVINLVTTPDKLWILWSVGCWGIAVLLHAALVLGGGSVFGKEWEDHKIKELMEHDKAA